MADLFKRCFLFAPSEPMVVQRATTVYLPTKWLKKKKYITEEEMVELIALCSILPGPTSTQTMVSIGYKMGGPLLAFFTILTWALPVLVAMTILSFLYQMLDQMNLSYDALRFIGPMAVGFIIIAAIRIGKR